MRRSGALSILGGGIGLGSIIAMILSWHRNHSLLWAAFHAIYSWFYVAYVVLIEKGVISPLAVLEIPASFIAAVAFLGIVAFTRA